MKTKDMRLKQLLKAHFDTNGPTDMGGHYDYILTPKLLSVYEEELNRCLEFNGSLVEVLREVKPGKPKRILTGYDEDNIPMYSIEMSPTSLDGEDIVTVKLGEKTKFNDVVKIYSISLTPEVVDVLDYINTTVDTAYVTPNNYNPQTFKPSKQIILTFDPETAQNEALKELKKELRDSDKDIDKPEFVVNSVDDDIREHEDEAQNLMVNVSDDDLEKRIKEKSELYNKKLIDLFTDCLYNPEKHLLPLKRGILIRCTSNSLVTNDNVLNNASDCYITLKQ